MLQDTQRARRGHDFFVWSESIPALYNTENVPTRDKTVWVHYFGPSQDWYIVEVDQDTGLAFCYADLGFGSGEWGYVDLTELEAVNVHNGLVVIERDCYWTPVSASDVEKIR